MHEELTKKITQMTPIWNEKQLRRYLGGEAEALGFGGIAIVSKISGKSRNTIVAGMKENSMSDESPRRVRRSGGGGKAVREKYPDIAAEIEHIVSASTYGNPKNPLAYTTKSTRKDKAGVQRKRIRDRAQCSCRYFG
jgi:hypothetical protein